MRIVTKIVLLVITSVGVIMGGVSLMISNKTQQAVNTQIDRVLNTNLEFVAIEILRTNEDIKRTTEIAARKLAIRKALTLGVSRGINQILNELVTVYPFFNYVLVVEPNGEVFGASTKGRDSRKVGGEQLLGLNINENPLINKSFSASAATAQRVVYGQPGHDPFLSLIGLEAGKSQWFLAQVRKRGVLIGWVVFSYNWEYEMSNLLRKVTKHLVDIGNPTLETILTSSDGQVVAGSDVDQRKFVADSSMLWRSRQVQIGDAPMSLIIVNDRSKTNRPLSETRNLLLTVVLASSILLITILYFILRQTILRKVVTLHAGTRELGQGNLEYRLPELGKDEFGKLASAFNTMIDRLQSTTVSRDHMDSILNSVTDGIVTIDDAGQVKSYNAAAKQLFGYKSDEVIGRNVTCLFASEELRQHGAYISDTRFDWPKMINQFHQLEGRRKDGTPFPLELIMTPMDEEGKHGFVAAMRDISERKEIEQMKNEFISTVSHELRTPLTSIKGALGMIVTGALGELPEKALDMLNIANKNTVRLISLINNILDLEKLESGRMQLVVEEVDLVNLVKQSIKDNEGYAKEYEVEFVLKDSLSEAMMKVDANQIIQVLSNLLSNAAKFSPSGEAIEIAVSKSGGMLRVSVADHGPGIPEKFRKTIFDKFSQADSTDARQKGGTGLGLNISKSIVEKHGGRIVFDTELGAGTTFHMDLPESTIEQYDIPKPKAQVSLGKGLRTLICEDDHDVAEVLSTMLENCGFTTEIAYNAGEAKKMLAAEHFDAMTVDIMLPDQDGLSLIRELRENEETEHLAMVVVSAKAEQARRDAMETHLGIVDWLEKPVQQESLIAAVHRAVQLTAGSKEKILYVEDDHDLFEIVSALLHGEANLVHATTLQEGVKNLQEDQFDLVIIDIGLPDGSGLDLLEFVKGNGRQLTPVILFSAQDVSKEVANKVEAVLFKSRTPNEKLVETIKSILPIRRKAA